MRDALFVFVFRLGAPKRFIFFSLGIFLLGASSNFDPTGFQPSREVLNRTSHTERNNSEMRKKKKERRRKV
jgi:poly-gamma-glutamate capsule biosynthesis protein CapA/YwtB (metallophosphatase superfamily)